MLEADLPTEVIGLLRDRLHSLDQLQVLLLLYSHRDREWTEDAVAEALKTPSAIVDEALRHLCAYELVEQRRAAEVTYLFGPSGEELGRAVSALADTFRRDPLGVMKVMNKHALERVRVGALHTFADAFVLNRKRGKDG